MRDMTPLCEIAKKYGTDKGGRHYKMGDTCHEYTPVYWDLFHERRNDIKAVLEIGVYGGGSLRMWEEFFPNARIIGLDHNPKTLFNEGRIECHLADQSSSGSLVAALTNAGIDKYDLMVDDGSHDTGHQILSLKTLLNWLAPGGVYIVEDMQKDCRPDIVGSGVPEGFMWEAIEAPDGLGRAHCECGCGGPENLLAIWRA